MAKEVPHLVAKFGQLRCSVCGHPFPPKATDAMFLEHVKNSHKPGQTTEDASQAAARIVKEATES